MSWKDNINDKINITTGDGKIYNLNYKLASRRVDFNVSEFNFPNIDGTLVNRQNIKGYKHELILFFQGKNHRQDFLDFEESSKDKRRWELIHPTYGVVLAQPISLLDNPTGISNTTVTISLIETIEDEYPNTTQSPIDQLNIDIENGNESLVDNFTAELSPKDTAKMVNTINELYDSGASSVQAGENSFKYLELFNQSKTSISKLVEFLGYPAKFNSNIGYKLSLFKNQFKKLNRVFNSVVDKLTFELYGNAIVTAMIDTAVNGTYNNSNEVVDVIQIVTTLYNDFILELDNIQTSNGAELDSFIPNYTYTSNLSQLINSSISQLFLIALSSKQERKVILDADSNVILLTHRFYGIDKNNSTIEDFISQNNIGNSELLKIKKGREVIYYV